MVKNLITLIILFFKGKISFTQPRQTKYVLYDKTKYLDLTKFINQKDVNILHMRGEQLNIIVILKCILKLRFKFIDYCNEYINLVNPKFIISFLDNYQQFYLLDKKKHQKKILIQNAYRTGDDSPLKINLKDKRFIKLKNKVDYAFIFNKNLSPLYKNLLGCKTKIIGSFRSNYLPINKIKKQKKLVYVSSYRENHETLNVTKYTSYKKFLAPEKTLVKYLYKYSQLNNIRLNILGSHKSIYKNEKSYFENILKTKKNWKFLKPKKLSTNFSYKILDRSFMVVGIDSTILYESLSRGTRVIFFNIRPSDSILRMNRFFGWPKKFNRKGPFWTDQLSQREVNFLLNKVKNYKNKKWNEIKKSFTKEFVIFDKNNSIFLQVLNTL
tara:strand:- start:3368 stop:4516 length:1149 start_codon:yes stop_codon:yes gene_type:complete